MRVIGQFCVISLCLPLLMGAEVYRWVDKDGVVNYTQVKPRGVPAEQLRTRGGVISENAETPQETAATGSASQELSTEQRAMRREMQSDERERQQHVARVREENCAVARETLETLTIRGRVRIRDESGEVRVVPEEERQARIKEAQEAVLTHCAS